MEAKTKRQRGGLAARVLKDISRFFNACVVLYQNRYNKKGVVVPEYDRKNFAPETVAMKLLVNGVNDSLFPALRARSRSMSGTGEDYMLTGQGCALAEQVGRA